MSFKLNHVIDVLNTILFRYPFDKINYKFDEPYLKIDSQFCYKIIPTDMLNSNHLHTISLKPNDDNVLNRAIEELHNIDISVLNHFKFARLMKRDHLSNKLYYNKDILNVKTIILNIFDFKQYPSGHIRKNYIVKDYVINNDVTFKGNPVSKYINEMVDEAVNKVYYKIYELKNKYHPRFEIEEFKGITNKFFKDYIDALQPIPKVLKTCNYSYKINELYSSCVNRRDAIMSVDVKIE